jgi:hypothetical protein
MAARQLHAPEAAQDTQGGHLGSQLAAEHQRPIERLLHGRRGVSLRREQTHAQGLDEIELLLPVLTPVREILEQFEAVLEVVNRLDVRTA